jgi:hypothetical protein
LVKRALSDPRIRRSCRSPKNAFDAFVCDDEKKAHVQSSLWKVAKEALKMILSACSARMP